MKEFLKRNRKTIQSALLMLVSVLVISIIAVLILQAFGIIYFDDGFKLNAELFEQFRTSWYGWLIILAAQIVITTLLCFVPGMSMAFIVLVQGFAEKPWQAFLIASLGVFLSSLIMYLTGRFGGYNLCKKILGREECEKASELLNHRGVVFFPLMMMFPIFPDDALVMIAGTLKMSLRWFIPSVVIGRAIGIATIVFGLGTIPYDRFTQPWHWILFILGCILFLVVVFYLAYRFNKYLDQRKHK